MSDLQIAVDRIRGFVETYALYRKYSVEEIFQGLEQAVASNAPLHFMQLSPRVASLECSNCGVERSFETQIGYHGRLDRGASSPARGSAGGRLETDTAVGSERAVIPDPIFDQAEMSDVRMKCTYCLSFDFHCWVEVRPDLGWIRKVGQLPRPAPTVDAEFKAALGKDAGLHRRALECIAESFGLGACAYLRRLLESQADPLLQVVLAVKKDEGADPEEIAEIEEAITRYAFDEKAKVLYRNTRESLRIGDDNAIKLVYKRLSEGVHSMDEEWCATVAVESLPIIEHLIQELNREHQRIRAKHKLGEGVKRLRSRGGGR